jgi:hypothetical protein
MRKAWQDVQDGRAIDVGFLYDSVEAHPSTPLTPEAMRIVYPIIRGDAVWLDTEATIQSVLSTVIDAARSRRMHLNQVIADEDALYDEGQWKALSEGNEDLILKSGDEIVLGFDGGKTDDATALVAIRIKDAAVFVQHLQEKPAGPEGDDWEVDRSRVDSAVHEAFRLHKVRGFYADVALWESYIDDWAETYREKLSTKATGTHAIAWDMRRSKKLVTAAHERLVQAIWDARLKVDPMDHDFRRHMLNVYRKENEYGVSFQKQSRESSRKIDIYAALMLAHEAYHDFRTRGVKKDKELTGRVWGF